MTPAEQNPSCPICGSIDTYNDGTCPHCGYRPDEINLTEENNHGEFHN